MDNCPLLFFGGDFIQQAKLYKTDEEVKKEKEDKVYEKKYKQKKEEFEKHYKPGATTVMLKDDKYYFYGDISHCKEKNIFHNAKEIKKRMEKNKAKLGHMNYNDPPTFEKKFDWEYTNKQRIEIYKDDLFVFEDNKIKVVEKVEK